MNKHSAHAIYPDLIGRTAFVSGGATGIGADVVRALCEQHVNVGFVDVDQRAGESLQQLLEGGESWVKFIHCDVTDTAALERTIDTVESLGAIDILVNNAANDQRQQLGEIGPEQWQIAMDVNLKHQFFAAKKVFEKMRERGRGSIINFGSVAPEMKIVDLSVYSICKSAIRGLTRSLAKEMGSYNVRVNSVVPGAILTEKQKELWYQDQSAIDRLLEQQCLPRQLNGGDVAAMVLFLASDVSSACTASEFVVNGGIT